MSSDKQIGPALPPTFRKESPEDYDYEDECKWNYMFTTRLLWLLHS